MPEPLVMCVVGGLFIITFVERLDYNNIILSNVFLGTVGVMYEISPGKLVACL